jgi:hypothetical protein
MGKGEQLTFDLMAVAAVGDAQAQFFRKCRKS